MTLAGVVEVVVAVAVVHGGGGGGGGIRCCSLGFIIADTMRQPLHSGFRACSSDSFLKGLKLLVEAVRRQVSSSVVLHVMQMPRPENQPVPTIPPAKPSQN